MDQSILEDLIDDAEGFARAVQVNKDRGLASVPYAFTDAIRSVALDANIVAMVETILEGEPWVVWGPNVQTGTPNAADGWHTDIESWFWPSITVVVGLSGCSDENTTRCIPGSQRLNAQPNIAGDRFDEGTVHAIARLMDPRCGPITQFQGFGDGKFYAFDAKVWHRGEPGGSAGRTVLFLHYQRARDRRIPMMEDHEHGTWLDVPAPYVPGPGAEAVLERSLQQIPRRQPLKRQTPKAFVRRLVRRVVRG